MGIGKGINPMKLTDDKRIEISDWLIESALAELSIEETICSFAEKMTSVGLPVHRINCSSNQRHQIMGAVDYTWDNDRGESKDSLYSQINNDQTEK